MHHYFALRYKFTSPTNFIQPRTSHPSDWKVVLGRHQQHAGGTEFDVTSIILHEDYNSGTSDNDLALLVLSKPARLTRTVNLVCLPPSEVEPAPERSFGNESNCFITGWGHTACECETFKPFSPMRSKCMRPVAYSDSGGTH